MSSLSTRLLLILFFLRTKCFKFLNNYSSISNIKYLHILITKLNSSIHLNTTNDTSQKAITYQIIGKGHCMDAVRNTSSFLFLSILFNFSKFQAFISSRDKFHAFSNTIFWVKCSVVKLAQCSFASVSHFSRCFWSILTSAELAEVLKLKKFCFNSL